MTYNTSVHSPLNAYSLNHLFICVIIFISCQHIAVVFTLYGAVWLYRELHASGQDELQSHSFLDHLHRITSILILASNHDGLIETYMFMSFVAGLSASNNCFT
jgi:hypothetical protein